MTGIRQRSVRPEAGRACSTRPPLDDADLPGTGRFRRRGRPGRAEAARASQHLGDRQPAGAGQPRDRRPAAGGQGRRRQARREAARRGQGRARRPARTSSRPSATQRVLVEEAVDVTLPGRPATRAAPGTRSRHADGAHRRPVRRMGWEIAEGPEVEAEWFNFDALNFAADHPARADAGHVLRRAARARGAGAAHPHLAGAGAHAARARTPPIYVVVPGQGVPHRRAGRHAHAGLPPGRGAGGGQGPDDGAPQGHAGPLRPGDVRAGRAHPAAAVVLPVHRAAAPRWTCSGSSAAARTAPAAPARAPAGSSGAAAAWSTRTCCAPAASTPRSTPASRSAWASSAR